MDAFFYFIADLFEAIFRIVDKLSPFMNKTLIVIGFIGTFYWITYQLRNPKGEKNYLAK